MASHEEHFIFPAPKLAPAPHLLLVTAPFYRGIADMMISGAAGALDGVGATYDAIEVPGALEVPTAIRLAARAGRYDGFVALGCVIRGATTHYETVCNDSSRAITLLGLEGHCIGNGILTVENMDQAIERAEPAQMNKGAGAAIAALRLVELERKYASPAPVADPRDNIVIAGSPGAKDIA
ncbi:6,7-dimethyl-8-ribityllumazine synthase [Pontivivens insulae]|uniref:6,7-dimethyl-8-ribityllumazine synthase n=1 Tax=Pontivivens insulae TaxID=1639689 RepID=A0A2R8ABS9_9RHOB|nr:6,7-dimethyl-8-ribityllumazine synthase [Pontivivens insulae]RED11155.1 6,7-dimethyl-8-ribityllumazine synthase [Pontivivens insulae]SPF29671.1 6,7-dimethyl-8-ribityllumazine synthase 1 [Pontivivens insulae]